MTEEKNKSLDALTVVALGLIYVTITALSGYALSVGLGLMHRHGAPQVPAWGFIPSLLGIWTAAVAVSALKLLSNSKAWLK